MTDNGQARNTNDGVERIYIVANDRQQDRSRDTYYDRPASPPVVMQQRASLSGGAIAGICFAGVIGFGLLVGSVLVLRSNTLCESNCMADSSLNRAIKSETHTMITTAEKEAISRRAAAEVTRTQNESARIAADKEIAIAAINAGTARNAADNEARKIEAQNRPPVYAASTMTPPVQQVIHQQPVVAAPAVYASSVYGAPAYAGVGPTLVGGNRYAAPAPVPYGHRGHGQQARRHVPDPYEVFNNVPHTRTRTPVPCVDGYDRVGPNRCSQTVWSPN